VASDGDIKPVSGKGTLGGTSDGYDRPWKHDPAAVAARQERANAAIEKANTLGRWPANLIHDGSDEVVAGFPNSTSNGGLKPSKAGMIYANGNGIPPTDYFNYGDTGSAARFFYCAKASKRDRDEGCDGLDVRQTTGGGGMNDPNGDDVCGKYGSVKSPSRNHHPTVKPTDLMRYLCRLVTPPSGVVLDPFMGSGSTGKAAVAEGFRFIGIEREAEYVEIARARIGQPTEALAPIQQEIATMKADIQLQFNALDVRQTKLERASKATKETPKS
jgi:site-specific DNA-methyltransferase (adenine-specific)